MWTGCHKLNDRQDSHQPILIPELSDIDLSLMKVSLNHEMVNIITRFFSEHSGDSAIILMDIHSWNPLHWKESSYPSQLGNLILVVMIHHTTNWIHCLQIMKERRPYWQSTFGVVHLSGHQSIHHAAQGWIQLIHEVYGPDKGRVLSKNEMCKQVGHWNASMQTVWG